MEDPNEIEQPVENTQQVTENQNQIQNPLQAMQEDNDAGYHLVTELPSRFKFYPEGTQIKARPLKVIDVKALSSVNSDNVNHVMNTVLGRNIKGIQVQDLLASDKLYLIFWLRANTYKDSGYELEYECPNDSCKYKDKYEFTLDDLEIISLKENYKEIETFSLKNGDTIKLRQLRVSEENEVQEFMEKNQVGQIMDEGLCHVAHQIESINGQVRGLSSKYRYLTELEDLTDYAKIENHIKDFDIGINPIIKLACKKCGGPAFVAVTFRPDFFIPKA